LGAINRVFRPDVLATVGVLPEDVVPKVRLAADAAVEPARLRPDALLTELMERAGGVLQTEGRLRALLDAVVSIPEDPSLGAALVRIVGAACELVGARYGAVVVSSADRLIYFITVRMTADQVAAIGDLPQGNGILGVVIDQPSIAAGLRGEVAPERHYAEKAALRVRGVTAVAEEITVRHATNRRTDARTGSRRGSRPSGRRPRWGLKAVVQDGRSTLTGPVTSQFQRGAAGRAVRYIKGVAGIHNEIVIKPIATSYGIKTAISAALTRSAQLESQHITVTAHDSTATLEGTVRSWHERQQAGIAAWSAPGVTEVTNHLRVAD
jgi:osmotically-inducible protein OsmY